MCMYLTSLNCVAPQFICCNPDPSVHDYAGNNDFTELIKVI